MGRAPRTYDAGLDKVNLQLDRGFVPVNEWMETSDPGLYAIGDIVAGLPQLAHVGAMAGIVVASKLAGKYARAVRKDRVPGCTYCDPQIGSVGLTEAQAKEKGYQVKVGKFPFVGNSKATIVDAHDGFVKVVSDAKYGEILGVHIIGPQATELIAEARHRHGARSHGRRDDVHHPRPPHALRGSARRLRQRGEHGHQRLVSSVGHSCRTNSLQLFEQDGRSGLSHWCPEIPEANGQGRTTRRGARRSRSDAIALSSSRIGVRTLCAVIPAIRFDR